MLPAIVMNVNMRVREIWTCLLNGIIFVFSKASLKDCRTIWRFKLICNESILFRIIFIWMNWGIAAEHLSFTSLMLLCRWWRNFCRVVSSNQICWVPLMRQLLNRRRDQRADSRLAISLARVVLEQISHIRTGWVCFELSPLWWSVLRKLYLATELNIF